WGHCRFSMRGRSSIAGTTAGRKRRATRISSVTFHGSIFSSAPCISRRPSAPGATGHGMRWRRATCVSWRTRLPAEAVATRAGRFDTWTDRMLSLRQSRAYAVVALALFGLVYAFGLATRHGLVDGFGHVIGGDLLTFRTASDIVSAGDGARLYDFAAQAARQQAALAPERVDGFNPFTSPPFVALACRPWAR